MTRAWAGTHHGCAGAGRFNSRRPVPFNAFAAAVTRRRRTGTLPSDPDLAVAVLEFEAALMGLFDGEIMEGVDG